MSHLWILSAASGTGKTSLVKGLLQADSQVEVAVSHTTRKPREGEMNGEDYHFVTDDEFNDALQKNAFLEYAKVFDRYYGTARAEVEHRLARGVDVVLEIDWQGAQQIQKSHPEAKSIFIFPPSLAQLRNRLESRGKDNQDVIERRLAEAKLEISKAPMFDYWLINDDFDTTLMALKSIVQAHRYERNIMMARHPELQI